VTLVTDAFNRANETPLASPWAITGSAGGGWNLASNAAVPADVTGDSEGRYTGSNVGANQFSQVKIGCKYAEAQRAEGRGVGRTLGPASTQALTQTTTLPNSGRALAATEV
jgi:hypothetical protein